MNLITLATFTQFGRVFPLKPGTKNQPITRWKFDRSAPATTDLVTIDCWLTKYPDAGWALVPDRAFIIDVDVKDGATGPASIEAGGGLNPTFTVRSPSGGTHHYYAPDPELPFQTRNSWRPGVDIRYGGDGFIVLPYTRTKDGQYIPETDLDEMENSVSQRGTRLADSILPPIPAWIKEKLLQEPLLDSAVGSNKSLTLSCDLTKCDKEWKEIKDRVRFLFFKKEENRRIWNHRAVQGMKDHTQSGYEWQLAVRLMNVGATDEEVVAMYRIWCRKHLRRIKQERFLRQTIPSARLATAEYVEEWKASQPTRRKHGTTTTQIIEAIQAGCKKASEIEKYTGLNGSTVRMQLKRMLAAGKLVKDPSGYDIPDVCSPLMESMAA